MASVMIFAGNFAPLNWAYCDGSLQSIADNSALFSLIGTTYGGDGQTTFALPDLRGRVPVGTGNPSGVQAVQLGEMGGSETVILHSNNLPTHIHPMTVSVSVSTSNSDGSKNPTRLLATQKTGFIYAPSNAAAGGSLAGAVVTVGPTGGSTPISVMQPYLAINYIICVYGIYPSRN